MRSEHTCRRPGGKRDRGRGVRMRAATAPRPAPPAAASTWVSCTAEGEAGWLAPLLLAAPHGGRPRPRAPGLCAAPELHRPPSPRPPQAARARLGLRAPPPARSLPVPRGSWRPHLQRGGLSRPALWRSRRVPAPERGAVLPRPARPARR
ncbi:hypothetical protein HPG69_019408 [Diceros bicornis minor]|uniref:Uncharacterized protein n=1 Tax=Diceros bicornis minor TaxID=77932 RepID=A0A7J7EZZ2_DICBM|nr:hypothetical protein HPG69_019408 [Diceros bicornis minor]